MTTNSSQTPDPTLHLPRILCLHGGGVTGEVFRLQSRAIISRLKPYFRLVFADGPFFCDAGPGIVPVYQDFGPFRRWLRWLPEHQEVDADTAIDEIWYQLRNAMEEDDAQGATGRWVGLMGFSQGAKLSASLLYDRQVREEKLGNEDARPEWRFAVLLAGRAPLVSLSPGLVESKALVSAADISEGFQFVDVDDEEHILRLPTVHVHGLQDPGLHLHRRLLEQYCDPKTTTLVEWDGTHRVPIKAADVDRVVKGIMDVAERTGAVKQQSIEHAGNFINRQVLRWA